MVKATRGSASLRVTIPQVVAWTLGLKPGDELSWVVDTATGSVRVERVVRTVPQAPPPERAGDASEEWTASQE
ncbi:MAG TPA: AbrB/MazE/SpoVT family DNA-binding domain-containing protein [Thermoplasmata archaeon]|nr:AbrB/MazE/SpoVT family DNA-binding domain-containing protein [Thermoplasmata archaeon]